MENLDFLAIFAHSAVKRIQRKMVKVLKISYQMFNYLILCIILMGNNCNGGAIVPFRVGQYI